MSYNSYGFCTIIKCIPLWWGIGNPRENHLLHIGIPMKGDDYNRGCDRHMDSEFPYVSIRNHIHKNIAQLFIALIVYVYMNPLRKY